MEKTGCQTFLQRSTQDPAPACERSLNPLLSGKVQTLFRRTDAVEEHGERSLLRRIPFLTFFRQPLTKRLIVFLIPWVGHQKALLNQASDKENASKSLQKLQYCAVEVVQ